MLSESPVSFPTSLHEGKRRLADSVASLSYSARKRVALSYLTYFSIHHGQALLYLRLRIPLYVKLSSGGSGVSSCGCHSADFDLCYIARVRVTEQTVFCSRRVEGVDTKTD